MTVVADIQKLDVGAVVDLFVLDATALGGSISRFHAGHNGLMNDVVWQGNTYSAFPIEASGFSLTSQGALPQPTLRVANVSGTIGSLLRVYSDLVGAKLTRMRTLLKYLDAANFQGGNANADPTAKFPDEIWYIERKVSETKIAVEFALSSAWDVTGVMLPRRQCIANVCTWKYRSPECSYAGGAVAKADDTPTSDLAQDRCGKRLTSCRMRFGQNAELPYGGFPAAGLIR